MQVFEIIPFTVLFVCKYIFKVLCMFQFEPLMSRNAAKKLRDNVDNINRSVQRDQVSFREIMKKEMEDEVKRNLDEQMCKVSNDLVSVQNIITETRTSAIEERDKEVRRNNVIIYQVPESSGDSQQTASKTILESV